MAKKNESPIIKSIKHILNVNEELCRSVINSCEVFPLAKQAKLPFPASSSRIESVFELLHIDVWGPFRISTHDRNKYFLTIVDDHSRVTWIYLLKLNSDAIVVIRNFLLMA